MLVYQVFIHVFICIDTERLTYFKFRSQAIGGNEDALTNHLTLSSLSLLQAANCCRNSRLVVDEDDLMWFKN